MASPPLVFISYSHKDSEFVNHFAALLVSYDLNVWKDSKDLPIGGKILKTIYEGIKSSSHFCVVISEASVQSGWVEEELSFAKMRQIDNTDLKIVPILISDIEIPDYVKIYRCANLQDRNLSPTNPEIVRIMRTFGIGGSGRLTHVVLGPARTKLLDACKDLSVSLWRLRDHVLVFDSIKKYRDEKVQNFAETLASGTSSKYFSGLNPYSSVFGHNPAAAFVPDASESLRKYRAEADAEMRQGLDFAWGELNSYGQNVLQSVSLVESAAGEAGLRLLDGENLGGEQFQLWRELGDILGNLRSLCTLVVSRPVSEASYISGKVGYFSESQKAIDNIVSLLESWAQLERATM